ncbi:WEB family protein [Hibiscus syriacus]|uniref:WEB family protein n=1 Tax=Hibiscus syriacus TaxID=106335 RepID=A0A6A3B326_HIBSY|nr:WEB family protein [Hibiscus syriacus]
MPRFKGNSKSKRFLPMSLFERFREAVFRIIMLSHTRPHPIAGLARRQSPEVPPDGRCSP